ncbi:hypothetical protein CABS01_07783 [Colletotrichum abscissum]|uniref:uncharacterized protein n=1 Tax=Colletotrichum abscissum TaxID=1671311 RepID=UPI0027D4FE5E|nr:uncharacterized protein CABS01_07783 [Colletotrichum abscissum]KAI3539481.1 hypothetical protein CSPX01_08927 [Colletotrichum filicis]KAK1510111.1 hypothetical protein CABS01_07783 [Colletotrichum abscissum]KAK1705872.1 hypothetical protein BDP67DRAFT_530514 [Colletotrichum lupini]
MPALRVKRNDFLSPRSKFGMSDFVPLPPRRHEAMLHFLSIQSRDSFIDRLHSTPFSRVMILGAGIREEF